MEILQQKPNTKQPAIVRASLSLFAERGLDGTSMRDIARAAGVQDAVIYRHFTSKKALAREICLSAYIWHCKQVQEIVPGDEALKDKLRAIVLQEFGMAERYPEAFVYVCENEQKLFADLPADVPTGGAF
jgi:AcrR family transcriptional regulator